MQANRRKHVHTFLIGYRSGGTPCIIEIRGVCQDCGPLTREQCLPVPRRPPGSSCCPSLLTGGFRPTTHSGTPGGTLLGNNVHCNNDWSSRSRTRSQAVTYEELSPEHKKKYDEIKALLEADLISSFERTRNHGIRWKGFSPDGALDNVDLSVPSEEHTRALRQEMNYLVAHSLHRHSQSLMNELERMAHRDIQEIIKNQYSPSGPILGSHTVTP